DKKRFFIDTVAVAAQHDPKGIVEEHGEENQSKIGRIPPAVEKQGAENKPGDCYSMMISFANKKKYEEGYW
ncbi:MAG: hypothetical protein N0E54_11120, partial [Candidatus Thiodiazotropha taylori]|nr:hypothetical protein [Candidatus Thiodiazotropha endolucinida]MCW4229280.1 hypothetical protein [Candidatus Thiodiazotropha taylori]